MIRVLLLAAFLAAGPILSADVVTSVSCTIYGTQIVPSSTVTDPSSCSLPDPNPFVQNYAIARATANASFSLVSNPNSFSSLSASQEADAGRDYDSNYQWVDSSAGSQVSVNEALFTTGSVRSGFVQVNVSGGRTPDFRGSSSSLDLSLGPIEMSCLDASAFATTCILWPNGEHTVPGYVLPTYGNPLTGYYPFTLGQAFNLSYSGSARNASSPNYESGADASVQFQFRFFEADGVTPVAVEAVPEPGSLALLGIALSMFALGNKKFLNRVRRPQ